MTRQQLNRDIKRLLKKYKTDGDSEEVREEFIRLIGADKRGTDLTAISLLTMLYLNRELKLKTIEDFLPLNNPA